MKCPFCHREIEKSVTLESERKAAPEVARDDDKIPS